MNKVMRKVWHLPYRAHVPIVLSVANVNRTSDIIYSRFIKFCNSGVMSSSSFVSRIFKDSCSLAYTGIGYNFMCGHSHLQDGRFTDRVINVSKIIRSIRSVFGFISPFEELIVTLSCS